MSTLGDRIVSNYNASSNQSPGGDCFQVAYDRVSEAYSQVCNAALPSMSAFAEFDRLWAIKNDPQSTWMAFPQQYRGKGSTGAMASISAGTLIDEKGIWAGNLEPGAVVQTWLTDAGYNAARDGNALPSGEIGHSFIFLEYVRAPAIVGMRIADQGTGWSSATNGAVQSDFAFWVAANVTCPTR